MDIIIYVPKTNLTVFPANVTVLFYSVTSFLPVILLKSFIFLLVVIFSQVDIIKVSIMSSYASQSLSKYHLLFNNEKTRADIEIRLDFI